MIRVTFERSPKEDALPIERVLSQMTGLEMGGFDFEIKKKSLDARRNKAKFVYTVDVFTNGLDEEKVALRCNGKVLSEEEEYVFPKAKITPKKQLQITILETKSEKTFASVQSG